MNWEVEVIRNKEDLIRDTQKFLQINSVMDESTAGPGRPFGEGVNASLTSLLEFGEKEGFTVKNLDGYAGHIEWGTGDEIVGVLCHVDVVPPETAGRAIRFQPISGTAGYMPEAP